MDFYLTADGVRIHFPMNPDKIQVQDAAHMESYHLLIAGGVQVPRGTEVSAVSWDGLFPGAARQSLPFVNDWQDPKYLVNTLTAWRSAGTRARLLVTETPINLDVYISQFQHVWQGGFGDCQYHIDLVQARSLIIEVVGDNGTVSAPKAASVTSNRPTPPTPETYTVKSGDTLWGITKRFNGSASSSTVDALYDLNMQVIGPDKNLIKPGQILRLPSNW